MVAINYRFQAFGFLSLPSQGIFGNATLKDQQLALEWVYENISNFGGDPERICLFGESAGAASVHLQVLNQKSRKMLKGAILQSNCALADWLMQKDGSGKSRKLAKLLGASGSSDEDALKALLAATPQQITENGLKTIEPDEIRRNLPFTFKPIVEIESEDSFMTKPPLELLNTEKIDIPVMMGLNDGDGMTMGSYYRRKLADFDQDHVRFVPFSLKIDPNSDEARQLGKKIKEFYFGDRKIDDAVITEFTDLMTDYHFTVPQSMTSEIHARYQPNSKLFTYEFKFDGKLNMFKELLKMSDVPRNAAHFDELFYLFDAKILGMEVDQSSKEWKMREKMCKMWTNFAKTGDPTPDEEKSLDFKWRAAEASTARKDEKIDIDYLEIDEKQTMKKNVYENRVDFWRKIYEKYNSSFLNPK